MNLYLIGTFACYLVIMLLLGLAAYSVTRSLSDYILGGRQLNGTVTGLSAGASDMSGWLFLGLPGAVYVSGLNQVWIAIGLTVGAYLAWRIVARRLRTYTELADNAITLPDYFEKRFRDRSRILRVISAFVILLFFTFYVSAGLTAAARLFEGAFGLGYNSALWLSAVIIISYALLGGFLAVCWTHYVQSLLMVFALIVVASVAVSGLGGWNATTERVAALGPERLDAFSGMTGIGIVSLLSWGLGYFGQPHILMRFMAVRSAHEIPRARRVHMSWMVLVLAGAVVVGLAGSAYFSDRPLTGSESVYRELVGALFSPWMTGIFLAAILAAILSTIDSQLLVSSSALAEDFYHSLLRRNGTAAEYIWVGRLTVVVVMLVAALLAYNQQKTVLALVAYAWAGFGASIAPVIVLSLLWRRMTCWGALAGMLVGAATVLVWGNQSGGWFELYEIVPGFVFSMLAIFVVSLMTPAPGAEILEEFDKVSVTEPVDADAIAEIPD